MELCQIFARCGLDVTLIAIVNAVISLLLRRFLKEKPRLCTVLTYLAGGVIYAVYASIVAGNAAYIAENITEVTQKCLTIGTLTMLICAATDRFISGGGADSSVLTIADMLEGVVQDKEACAKDILKAAKTMSGEQLDEAVKTAIEQYGGKCDGVTEGLIARAAERLKAAEQHKADDGTQTD